MAEYLVTWRIEVEADSAEEAARLAREAQTDPDTIALVFEVQEYKEVGAETVDLYELDGRVTR